MHKSTCGKASAVVIVANTQNKTGEQFNLVTTSGWI